MQLVVQDLNDNPEQQCDFNSNVRSHISRIAVWVFANNIGDVHTFRFYLEDSDSNVLFDQTLTGAQIKSAMDFSLAYFHGKLFLDPPGELRLSSGTYYFKADQLTGYSSTTYLSMCKDWERPYSTTNPNPANIESAPFFVRFYDNKGREL